NGAIGEVDARAAKPRFKIEIRFWADVFRNVGDMNLKFISAVGALSYEHSIIEIARCFSVDRHNRQIAEIFAATHFRGIEMGNAARFSQHIVREYTGQLVLA